MRGEHQKKEIQWLRASDFVTDPRFFVGGATRFDINQGKIGNCWMLASLANLTMHKKLLQKVVHPNQTFVKEEYAGEGISTLLN